MRDGNNLQPEKKLSFLLKQKRDWKGIASLQDPVPSLSSFLAAGSLTLSIGPDTAEGKSVHYPITI